MRGVAAALLGVLLGLAAIAPPAAAEEDNGRIAIARAGRRPSEWPEVAVQVRWGPSAGESGWGWVRVELRNGDETAHVARIVLSADDDRFRSVTRRVSLEARGRATVWLPRLPGGGEQLTVAVGEASAEFGPSGDGEIARVLLLGSPAELQAGTVRGRLEALLQTPSGPGHRYVSPSTPVFGFTQASWDDLPPSWTYLTSTSLVVVDGASAGSQDPERQRTLRRYVEAGGTLLVLGGPALGKGPLGELVEGAPAEEDGDVLVGRGGLGRWFTTPTSSLSEKQADVLGEGWLPVTTVSSWEDAQHLSATSTLMPSVLGLEERIPGLGRVNARLYFFLLLLFALLVGPVAYLVLRRRRRLTAMVVVVPAAGLLFAASILAFGILSEGLGTRGVVTSFSVLDQRTHEATCVASRTLFAGWSRDALRLSPDTALHAPGVTGDSVGYSRFGMRRFGSRTTSGARLHLDADLGAIEPAVLPSRTVTALATVGRARARERLRFVRQGGGGYEVSTAEGFAPVPAYELLDPLVLRDAKGGYHVGGGGAPLRSVSDIEGRHAFAALLAAAGAVDPSPEESDPSEFPWERYVYSSSPTPRPTDRGAFVRRILPGELPPSSYLAFTTRAPGFDDLGLDVEWKASRHLTFGLLAADDIDG